jgi:hypothetical protein
MNLPFIHGVVLIWRDGPISGRKNRHWNGQSEQAIHGLL